MALYERPKKLTKFRERLTSALGALRERFERSDEEIASALRAPTTKNRKRYKIKGALCERLASALRAPCFFFEKQTEALCVRLTSALRALNIWLRALCERLASALRAPDTSFRAALMNI